MQRKANPMVFASKFPENLHLINSAQLVEYSVRIHLSGRNFKMNLLVGRKCKIKTDLILGEEDQFQLRQKKITLNFAKK